MSETGNKANLSLSLSWGWVELSWGWAWQYTYLDSEAETLYKLISQIQNWILVSLAPLLSPPRRQLSLILKIWKHSLSRHYITRVDNSKTKTKTSSDIFPFQFHFYQIGCNLTKKDKGLTFCNQTHIMFTSPVSRENIGWAMAILSKKTGYDLCGCWCFSPS